MIDKSIQNGHYTLLKAMSDYSTVTPEILRDRLGDALCVLYLGEGASIEDALNYLFIMGYIDARATGGYRINWHGMHRMMALKQLLGIVD